MTLRNALMSIFVLSLFATANAQDKGRKASLHDQFSGQGYGTAGCGLGSVVFGKKPGMIQIVAATLNGTGFQTFAIASGTSNCVDSETRRNAALFIENNRAALETEAARGQGETVANLGSLLGCQQSELLGAQLQRNYKSVFAAPGRDAEQVRDSIYGVIQSDSALNQTCHI